MRAHLNENLGKKDEVLEALRALHEMYFAAIEVHKNDESKAVNISDAYYEFLSHNFTFLHHLLISVALDKEGKIR